MFKLIIQGLKIENFRPQYIIKYNQYTKKQLHGVRVST